MTEPHASRPHMPGYGTLGPDEGTGLLPWSWAREQLVGSRNYWLGTGWPDGRPHTTPVWGVWHEEELWFSSSLRSRKARNLLADPRCTAATQDPEQPVVVEGAARVVRVPELLAAFVAATNVKYATSLDVGFLDPAVNGTFVLRPRQVIGLREEDFTGSPTRWRFGA